MTQRDVGTLSSGTLPARIISYAWGDVYVEELLAFTIPALLAPGNLPYVASQVACEVVLLTEERFFERMRTDPAVARIRKHCPIRLLALDDLIAAGDKYGMSLTYALHRGFSDLGPAMTNCMLFFLNADFILADGSLRNLLPHLMRGERIVASPSYCVVKKDAVPDVLVRLDKDTSTLAIPPRELAKLAMRHRHNTIRAKTVNQRAVHMRYMEQFYWLVDEDTLLGHQLPVAIVGMRPEKHVAEPTAFWDHGLMKEFCPTSAVKLLGDSDEFLMIELRDKNVAQHELIPGWPPTVDLAERIIVSMTPYQRDFAHMPLTLHAAELPPGTDDARRELRAFMDEWLSCLPKHIASHVDHPQWSYHWPAFTEARHRSLSKMLGHKTRMMPPPPSLSDVDQCWWRLDGLQKTVEYRRELLLEVMSREIETLYRGIDQDLALRDEENKLRFVGEIWAIELGKGDGLTELIASLALDRTHPGDAASSAQGSTLGRYESSYLALREDAERKRETLAATVAAVRQNFRQRVQAIEVELAQPLTRLKSEYGRLVQKRVASAAIPFVRTRIGPSTETSGTARGARGLATRAYSKVFGRWPRVNILSPLWGPVRPLHREVALAVAEGADDVLFVGQRTGVVNGLVELSGMHAWVSSVEGVVSGNLSKAFDGTPQFDLCICDLDFSEIERFDEIAAALRPFLREGSRILGFFLNSGPAPAPVHQLDPSRAGGLVSFVGSRASARALEAHAATFTRGRTSKLLHALRIAFRLTLRTPMTLASNLAEAATPESVHSIAPQHCTSVTIAASIPWFEGDDGTAAYAKAAGIYIEGVEAPAPPERRVDASVANPPGTTVILTFGQSNAANEGEGTYEAQRNVNVFNIFDMNYYGAADPLPGASGFGGSVWSRLGDRLIEAGTHKSVLFVPIAFGATYIRDWTPSGQCYRRLQFALLRLARAGLKVDAMCWHQGEADANHTDMSTEEYKRHFLRMVKHIRIAGVRAPIYIAITSLCENNAHPYQNREQIRLAQKQLVSIPDRLLPGPDTDCIDSAYRHDGCHFSASGLDLAAQAWFESLTARAGRRT